MNAQADAAQPKMLDRVRREIRTRHLSLRTEEAYVGWICQFILFHGKRHPAQKGGRGPIHGTKSQDPLPDRSIIDPF